MRVCLDECPSGSFRHEQDGIQLTENGRRSPLLTLQVAVIVMNPCQPARGRHICGEFDAVAFLESDNGIVVVVFEVPLRISSHNMIIEPLFSEDLLENLLNGFHQHKIGRGVFLQRLLRGVNALHKDIAMKYTHSMGNLVHEITIGREQQQIALDARFDHFLQEIEQAPAGTADLHVVHDE